MDIDEFVTWWRGRERADIERMIDALPAPAAAAGDDVEHVRACAEVGVALRRAGRTRLGGRAAHRARTAVVDACRRTGVLDADRRGATRLARAAGDAALALSCRVPRPVAEELLAPFSGELPTGSLRVRLDVALPRAV